MADFSGDLVNPLLSSMPAGSHHHLPLRLHTICASLGPVQNLVETSAASQPWRPAARAAHSLHAAP